MGTVNLIPDQNGITWRVDQDENDPVWFLLRPLVNAGFSIQDLILPPELPRHRLLHPPQWDGVIALWESEGDTPAFRSSVMVQQIREQGTKYLQEVA